MNFDTSKTAPTEIYRELWQVLDERYALFSVKNVNWDSIYSTTALTVSDQLSEAELFDKCVNLLEPLKDGHVSLIGNGRIYTYENFFRAYPTNFNLKNVISNYLGGQYTILGPIIYKIVNNVAYVHYASFRENITDDAVDLFFSGISNVKGLIIDVRSNSGGNLSNVKKIFARLINKKRLVKYELHKKGQAHTDFYEPEEHSIEPAGFYHGKPVIVLTNRSCFSACNDFVLYMSGLDNVRLVGDTTGGGGAVPAEYILSNGWKLQYSSSMTMSPLRSAVESGIPADVNIGISPVQETRGIDPILEKAYELLQ